MDIVVVQEVEAASSPLGEIYQRLASSQEGLGAEEAQSRLAKFGHNEIPEKKRNPILQFLSYLWGPIPWMIEVAAVLSAVVQHWVDFCIILVLLIVNAIVGFWEEFQAGNTIAALKEKLAIRSRVKRSRKWITVPSRDLVPGDLIRLRMGDIVPADAKLEAGDPISVDQSALTGESLPVTKNPGETLYSGSIVKQGEIEGLVYSTGLKTYFGRTASLTETAHTVSHLQHAILKIGDYLIFLALVLVSLIVAVALFRGDPVLQTIQFVLVLTVAAIPVAMPTVLSVTMAVGARLLAKNDAVVSRLTSIEELAGMDVLCSDKTGTLTQNKLVLGEPFLMPTVSKDWLMESAVLASRAENQDPIDLAIISGANMGTSENNKKVLHFSPFDPVRKRTEAEIQGPDQLRFKVSKGAPQVILELAHNANEIQSRVEQAILEFAKRGFRSLGVARTDNGGKWQFLGILPLFDPPREDAKATLDAAKEFGIKVKMITGDQQAIAKETAERIGLGTNILDASIFMGTKSQEVAQNEEAIEQADGFSQVYPEHKFHVVEVLQKKKHVVGMTGDGVNDAPALRKADVGIAVSGATDVARSAAAITLLSPGLSVLVEAVKQSRQIFQRMKAYAIYRIAETIRVLLFMTLSILIFNFYPVSAVMIVLLALLNDGSILSIAYDRVRFSQQPDQWDFSEVLGIATLLGSLGVISSFGLFYLAKRHFGLDASTIQSLIYLKFSVAGQLTIFLSRTRGPFWSIRPSKVLLGAVMGAQTIATLIAVYGILMPPLGWRWALVVWGYALAWALVNDRFKLLAYKVLDRKHSALWGRPLALAGHRA